jgi:hypothetical protein
VAHGVDAAMEDVQAPSLDAVVDHAPAQPELLELPARDHAVLPASQRGDRRVRATRCTFATSVGVKVNRIRHAASMATHL